MIHADDWASGRIANRLPEKFLCVCTRVCGVHIYIHIYIHTQVLELEGKLRRHDENINSLNVQTRQHTQTIAAHEAENEKLRASLRSTEQDLDKARAEVSTCVRCKHAHAC